MSYGMQAMSHESSGLCWCGPNNHGPEKHRPIVEDRQIRCAACGYAMHRITRPDGTSSDTVLLDLFATNHTEPATEECPHGYHPTSCGMCTSPQQAYPQSIADTCCGKCETCYVDQVTGA